MVAALVLGATRFEDIVERAGLAPPAVGRAVRRLESAGLLSIQDNRYELHAELFKQAARAERPAPEDLGIVDPAEESILRAFFRQGRLTHFPTAPSKLSVVLGHIVTTFEPGVRYPEREVNAILAAYHADFAALRRGLVDEGLLSRAGGMYWRSGGRVDVLAPYGRPGVPAGHDD